MVTNFAILRFVYEEEIERDLNRILKCECRCDERLRGTGEGSTRLGYTGLCGGLEHLMIETRLRHEGFESVKGDSDVVSGINVVHSSQR